MSVAQNIKDYFFRSRASQADKENTALNVNLAVKKAALVPTKQKATSKTPTFNPLNYGLEAIEAKLSQNQKGNIIANQDMRELGLLKKLNANKVKKTLNFEKNPHIVKKELKDKTNQLDMYPIAQEVKYNPAEKNTNKTTILPEITRNGSLPQGQKEIIGIESYREIRDNKAEVKMTVGEANKETLKSSVRKGKTTEQKGHMNNSLKVYVNDIIDTLKEKDENSRLIYCLKNHKIPPTLRSKMVDWMIEVMCSYKCSDQTFFLAVNIMDTFFQKCPMHQTANDLHLVGVTSMFVASKFEEIYPMRLGIIYEKIGHKKLTPDDIIKKEAEILQVLGFNLVSVTIYDFITNVLFQLKLEEIMSIELYEYFQRVCLYLAKANMYDYELISQYTYCELAACTVFVAFKVMEQLDNSFPLGDMIDEVVRILKIEEEVLYVCGAKILSLAKNFEKVYPSFKNLKQFHSIGTVGKSSSSEPQTQRSPTASCL